MSSPVPETDVVRPVPRRPNDSANFANQNWRHYDQEYPKGLNLTQTKKELDRLKAYGLDIVGDDDLATELLTDKTSPFFGTSKSRRLKNKALLPYKTETIRDQYKYLSHIIAHIYIAVKSSDLKGNLSVSVEDLESAREIIANNKDQEAYINSINSRPSYGAQFETLHTNESEAIEDDENEDESDYYDSSDEEDEDAANSTPIMKIESESASIIALKYWTKELKNLLKMGLVLPLEITKKLIKVFYGICLSRGQNIDITFYTQAINLLTREKKLLVESEFVLNWEPVYAEFETTICSPTTFGPSMKDTRFKKLIGFALSVKHFFDRECIPYIAEKILSKCCPQTITSSMIHLTVMLPMHFFPTKIESDGTITYDKRDVRYYLPVLFDLWLNYKSDKEINCLLSVIMNIAVENLKKGSRDHSLLNRGKYGIFTREQYTFMMNQLFLSSQIRHKDNRMVKYCKIISQIIINSLSSTYAFEEEGVLDFLKTFADAVYTMIHPSNSGPWSNILSEIVKKLALSLHLRVQGEKDDRELVPLYHPNYTGLPQEMKLNDEIIDAVVKLLLPLIHLGAQSKSSGNRRHYNEALQVLCFMRPSLVLDALLLDWYSSFESVNSTHRIPIVINQLTHLVRIMVQLPVYRVHIPRLMSMLIPAIDSNDPEKTIITTDFITIAASVIPFADLTEGTGDGGMCAVDFTSQHLAYLESKFYEAAPASKQFCDVDIPDSFQYDAEYEVIALKSATSSFKEFLIQFCDSCFKYLENSPAIDGSNTIESQACALISYCFEAVVESMSDELFNVIADKFFDYVTNNVKHEVALVFCNVAEAVVKRDPKQLKRIMEHFMPHILSEIVHGAGVSRSQEVLNKDQRLIWNLRILCGAISGSSSEIVPYLDDLETFITIHSYKLRGTAGLCAAMIASCALSTISYMKPLERRLVSPAWLQEHGGRYSEECWGGFQFSDTRFNLKYLDYEWYIPQRKEVKVVAEHFTSWATPSLDHITDMTNKLTTSHAMSLDEVDQLGFHIELLEGLLKGACCLFDQSYQESLGDKRLEKLKSTTRLTALSSSPSLVNMAKSDSSTSLSIEVLKNNTRTLFGEAVLGNDVQKDVKEDKEDDLMNVDDDSSRINPINPEIEIEIEREDSASNLSILSADIDTELPTRAPTPGLTDSIDVVDASLTKRADILFSYGSYFSTDVFSKAVDPDYNMLHVTRNKIGKALHELIATLSEVHGSRELIGKVIQCMSTWLNDCGYYSNDNELYTDNLHFISLLDFPGVFAPYSRTVLGARLAVYHCSRINISCCTRLPTRLDKLLIEDLVSLTASPYGMTASHAASVLGTSLNRVMNCTSAIFDIFKDWEKALADKNKETLLNIMLMLDKKKLRGLVEKSSAHLPKYEELLCRSADLNEEEITVMSMKLFKSIKKYVKIPAAVCIMDESLVEDIRPPDYDVDTKISVLKLAKAKKKVLLYRLLSNLVNLSIKRLSKRMNWKFVLVILELITTIQSHIEVPLERDSLSTLFKYVDGTHPEIAKKGMFWIASIFDTVESRAYNNYDIDNMLAAKPNDPSIVPFVSVVSENSSKVFFKEVVKIEDPKFFIDNKNWISTVPWNKNLFVVKLYSRLSLGFSEKDDVAVREFASGINKSWVLALMKTHIDESESTSAFFPGIVYFFTTITTLILFGYAGNLTLQDMFDITDEMYQGDDRATHVAVTEVFCGILFACKNDEKSLKIADAEIANRVQSVFMKDLTQSSYKTWTIFAWWLSSHFDLRRTPKILNLLCVFDVDNDVRKSPFTLMCRLSFLKSYIGTAMNRFYDFDKITHQMFTILGHPYDIISKEVSAILYDILFYKTNECIESFDEFMERSHEDTSGMGYIQRKQNTLFHEHFKLFLKKTLDLAKENEGKTAQEVVNSEFMYHVKGATALLLRILKTSANVEIVEYIRPYILPLVIELDKVKEACNLADISIDTLFLILGSIRFRENENDEIIELLEDNMGWANAKLTQYKHSLAFFGVYGTVRFLERSSAQRKRLMGITYSMLFNEHLYLREQYGQNLKIFIHLLLDSEREKIISSFIKKFRKVIKQNKNNKGMKLTIEQANLVHGATLGLCALVEAYPYSTPPPKWLPEVLTILEVKCTSYSGATGRAAKDTLSQFKKTRQDTWHIDSKFFTEEQLEDLEGVLYKSYYL